MKFPQILLGCSGYRSWRAPFQVCSTAAHLAVPAACAGGHLGLLCSAPSPWPTTAGHIAGASQGFPTAKPLFPARRWERAGEAPVPLGKGSTHHHGPQRLPGLAPCPGGAVLAGTHQGHTRTACCHLIAPVVASTPMPKAACSMSRNASGLAHGCRAPVRVTSSSDPRSCTEVELRSVTLMFMSREMIPSPCPEFSGYKFRQYLTT